MTTEQKIARLEALESKHANGTITPEEIEEANNLVSEIQREGNLSTAEVKQSKDGKVDDKKAFILSRAWKTTISYARQAFAAIWRWIKAGCMAVFGFVGAGCKKVASWFKKSDKQQVKGEPKVIDIKAAA